MLLMPVFAEDVLHGGHGPFGTSCQPPALALWLEPSFWPREGILWVWEKRLSRVYCTARTSCLVVVSSSGFVFGHRRGVIFLNDADGFRNTICRRSSMTATRSGDQPLCDDMPRCRIVRQFSGRRVAMIRHADTLMIDGIACLLASIAFATKLSMITETAVLFIRI
jgi:hypothetical protein